MAKWINDENSRSTNPRISTNPKHEKHGGKKAHTKGQHNQIAQNYYKQTSPVVQWLRICQCRGHRFNSCSEKIPHTLGQLNPCMAMTKTCTFSVYALQYEKPQQREACAQKRRPSVAPPPKKNKKNYYKILKAAEVREGKDMFTCKDKDNIRFLDGNNAKENTATSLKYWKTKYLTI